VTELFREISKKIAERPGGYTRILKTGYRAGDNADMCIIELVDYNEAMLAPREEKAKTTRRKRAGAAKKKEPHATAPEPKAAEAKAPAAEAPETTTEPEPEEQK